MQDVHQLQRSIVRQNLHNAMSPISAISGYLELINISLSKSPDLKQIDHYRKQIEEGVNQVNTILEQVMEVYSDDSYCVNDGRQSIIEVDFNWVVSEVSDQMNFAGSGVKFFRSKQPLHVHIDLFMAKLIILNLISYALKCSAKDKGVKLKTGKVENKASFAVIFDISEKKKAEVIQLLSDDDELLDNEQVYQNSFNEGLITSRKLAEQIDAYINFRCVNEEVAMLNLNIPLSHYQN